ncbi:MAG TPA: hypothetical protein OIL76_05280 [Veillonellaceae bacterium]|nr:hypothetical protein [Veillonellaceae bacterium]
MDIRQGLKDIGCKEGQYEEYMRLSTTGERVKFLKLKRKDIMDDLHTAQWQIDCIDFLIREVRKED